METIKVGDLLRLNVRYYEDLTVSTENLRLISSGAFYFRKLNNSSNIPEVVTYHNVVKRDSEMDKKRFLVVKVPSEEEETEWVLYELNTRRCFWVTASVDLGSAFKSIVE